MSELAGQTQKPELNFKNFLCCFNRSKNGSRYALLARLYELGWYNEKCCTKHFSMDFDQIKDSVINICWWMRGGISHYEAWNLSEKERSMIQKLIKSNLETMKKTKMPMF
jgi:hypothetical protein